MAPRALADDLERAAAVIAQALRPLAALYRPPYGIFSPAGLALVRRRGWAPLLWSRWGATGAPPRRPASIAAAREQRASWPAT